jgi:membrane protein
VKNKLVKEKEFKNSGWKKKISLLPGILRDAFKDLSKNDPLRMAGATAFFTTFALPPILIILLQLLGLIFDPITIRRQVFRKLSGFIGRQSVHQIVETLIAFRKLAANWLITIGGFIFLLFVATTLFKVIKSSLNQLWRIRVVQRRSLWESMRTRSRGIFLILVAGALFLMGLLAEAIQAMLGSYLFKLSTNLAAAYNYALNYILSVAIVTFWFAILFRFLPDGKPAWRVTLTGAFLTSILFNAGKLILRTLLISYSNINTVYGTSGSIILLLLFVFYTSLILYYGAAFTRLWGLKTGSPIRPLPYAMHYEVSDVTPAEDAK